MKKILIATGIFPPDIGGPATYGMVMSDALKKQGFDVNVVVFSRTNKKLPKGLRHLVYFFKLLPMVKSSDLVLSLNLVSAGFPALIAAKIFKKKFICRMAGDYAWEMAFGKGKTNLLIDDYQRVTKRGLLHKIQTYVSNHANSVIVPSDYLKKIVSGWGVKEDKIKVIYNGVDFKPSALSKEDARIKIGIHGNIIVSVGRLVPWKGFRMLIKIMPKLMEINQFFRLIIVGDGPERKNLEAMVKNLGFEKKIFIVGKKSKEDLATYMAAGDMFVLNSGYEGFSHQILEAMAAEIPVIASGIPGNKEIIKQGINGFLVKYNDEFNIIEAIKTLHEHPEVREEFVQEGKKTVQNFGVEKMISQTINLLSE